MPEMILVISFSACSDGRLTNQVGNGFQHGDRAAGDGLSCVSQQRAAARRTRPTRQRPLSNRSHRFRRIPARRSRRTAPNSVGQTLKTQQLLAHRQSKKVHSAFRLSKTDCLKSLLRVEKSMGVKKPGYASKTGKKAATETEDRTASNSVFHTLTRSSSRSGGQKAEFFRVGGYTKNGNRKFYKKKAERPVSLVTGRKLRAAKLREILVKNHNCVQKGTHH